MSRVESTDAFASKLAPTVELGDTTNSCGSELAREEASGSTSS